MAGPTQNSKFTLLIPNSDPLGEVVILQSLEVEKIGWYVEAFVQQDQAEMEKKEPRHDDRVGGSRRLTAGSALGN